jgi:inosose dehydratase
MTRRDSSEDPRRVVVGSSQDLNGRVAAAPISWGVCEVPGWGWQYDAPTVLEQMRSAGVTATEFGPVGFLPADPVERAEVLEAFGLRPVGGFLPVLLHDPSYDPVPDAERTLAEFVTTGATTMVLAASTGTEGYDSRPELDESGWQHLLGRLDRIAELAAAQGIAATLHPHVGTMVENAADVDRVLTGSAIGLCLDTGHLLVGGVDPVALAVEHPERIRHVHLKDVDDTLATKVRAGELGYTEAVGAGLYRPLGEGDIDIARIVRTLDQAGYTGWYVLEQDTVLTAEPSADGPAPIHDVQASLEFLRREVTNERVGG